MSRRGFTLIEVLIAIGIILLLAGAVLFAVTRTGDAARGRAASVTLEQLRSMLAEFEATAGLTRQPPVQWGGGAILATGTRVNLWKDGDVYNVGPPEPDPARAPGRVGADNRERTRYDAVRNTQLAISMLATVPANRTALASLRMLKMEDVPESPDYDESKQPGVPLDPWGSPIVFVPAGGLEVIVYAGNPSSHANPEKRFTIRSPDGRPFWASAGPDGAFSEDPLNKGDDGKDMASDNVYSF